MIKALTAQLQEQTAAYTARWSGPSSNSQQDMDHQRVGNHQQREVTQMESTRPTIGAHTTMSGPFTHLQNAKD